MSYSGTTILGIMSPKIGDPKTTYLSKLDSFMSVVDAHDHTTGKGSTINTSAITDQAVTYPILGVVSAGEGLTDGVAEQISVVYDTTQFEVSSGNIQLKDDGLTNGYKADRAQEITTGVAGGYVRSTNINTSTTSTSYVTFGTVTLTTTGRPVVVRLIANAAGGGTTGASYVGIDRTTSSSKCSGLIKLTNGTNYVEFPVVEGGDNVGTSHYLSLAPAGFFALFTPAAGSVTYTVQALVTGVATTRMTMQNVYLVAYEI